MTQFATNALLPASWVLAALSLAALVRAVLGPRFTDRIVAVNVLNTLVVALISLLSVYFREDFLIDVALVYALLSFLTVASLSRLVAGRAQKRKGEKVHGA
jgi:multicomponent Na+:H+ antiporter subunit F